MSIFSLCVIASFTFPLLAGVLALLVPRWNVATQILFILGGICGLVGSLAHPASFFAILIALGVIITSLYAIAYLPKYSSVYSFRMVNSFAAFFIIGMQGVVLAPTIISFLFFWEIMSVAAYFLIIAERKAESLSAGLLYFVITQLEFVALLAAFMLASGGDVFASWAIMASHVATLPSILLSLIFFLFLIGFGGKADLVPLHVWLPQAYPQTPSHISALLSGTMLSVAVYGFLQILPLFASIPVWWGVVVLFIGLLTAFTGALYAAVDTNAKAVLAWSSVENMGLIFSGIGVGLVFPPLMSIAVIFVYLHLINHFFFKTGLFLAVGAVVSQLHTKDINQMGGLASVWKPFSVFFLLLSVAASALPPFSTFLGEWMLFQNISALFSTLSFGWSVGLVLILLLIGVVAGLALFANIRLFALMFTGRSRSKSEQHLEPMPILITVSVGVCALALIIIAPVLVWLMPQMFANTPLATLFTGILPFFTILFGMFALVAILMWDQYEKIRITDTWDCGAPLTPRMQYSASGFAAPIVFFYRFLLRPVKKLVSTPVSETNPWIAKKKIEWSMVSFWESHVYAPIARLVETIATWIRKSQNGVVQVYILFIFLAFVVSLLFAL